MVISPLSDSCPWVRRAHDSRATGEITEIPPLEPCGAIDKDRTEFFGSNSERVDWPAQKALRETVKAAGNIV